MCLKCSRNNKIVPFYICPRFLAQHHFHPFKFPASKYTFKVDFEVLLSWRVSTGPMTKKAWTWDVDCTEFGERRDGWNFLHGHKINHN